MPSTLRRYVVKKYRIQMILFSDCFFFMYDVILVRLLHLTFVKKKRLNFSGWSISEKHSALKSHCTLHYNRQLFKTVRYWTNKDWELGRLKNRRKRYDSDYTFSYVLYVFKTFCHPTSTFFNQIWRRIMFLYCEKFKR